MASSTRGGKRGSKPKRKALKTYKTASGAQQYGSMDDFYDLANRLHDKSMAISRSGGSAKDFSDTVSKMYKAEAGYEAAKDKEYDDPFYKKGERDALRRSDYFKNKSKEISNKKYGGKVTKMKEGGKVPSKYKGFSKLPENVQRQMDSGLAEKYEYGGKVGGCRGGGAAIKGTKFTGCK